MIPRNRKVWLNLLGTVAIAVLTWWGTIHPEHKEIVTAAIFAVAAMTGVTNGSIAYEDSQQANARANIQAAESYAMGQNSPPEEVGGTFR